MCTEREAIGEGQGTFYFWKHGFVPHAVVCHPWPGAALLFLGHRNVQISEWGKSLGGFWALLQHVVGRWKLWAWVRSFVMELNHTDAVLHVPMCEIMSSVLKP